MYYSNCLVALGDASASIPAPALHQLMDLVSYAVLAGNDYEEQVVEIEGYLRSKNQQGPHLHVKAYRSDYYTLIRIYNDDLVDVLIAVSTGVKEATDENDQNHHNQ